METTSLDLKIQGKFQLFIFGSIREVTEIILRVYDNINGHVTNTFFQQTDETSVTHKYAFLFYN